MSFFASRRLLRGRSPLSLTLPRRGGGDKDRTSSFLNLRRGGNGGGTPTLTLPPRGGGDLRVRDGERLRRYRELLDFYEGKHFARDRGRVKLVVNYARGVADKGVSYLFGRGVHFSVPAETETREVVAV